MKKFPLILLGIAAFSLSGNLVKAQVDSLGVALPVEISSEVQNGDILCSYENGLSLCDKEYDPAVYGVVSDSPALYFESPDMPGAPLVVKSGDVLVRVSAENGPIAAGDLIATSDTPGVGKKASLNGFVLGLALEEFTLQGETGEILVALNIHPTTSFVGSGVNLIANIRQALSAPSIAPLDSLRYLLAFVVALISFGLGFVYFGRVVRTGVEAIGRNPLASRMIQITVFANILITLAIVVAGLGISLLILII